MTLEPKNILHYFPIFSSLRPSEITYLRQHLRHKTYQRGEMIYRPGMEANQLYFLMDGRVKIGTYSDEDREVLLSVSHQNEVFGLESLLGVAKHQYFARAHKDKVRLMILDGRVMQNILEQNSIFCANLLRHSIQKKMQIEHRMESLFFKNSRQRITNYLKSLLLNFGRPVGYEHYLKTKLTHEEIAKLTNTSRQTVTTVFNHLKKQNIIHYNRSGILVRDMEQLK
ncbi:MAG: Crp/Fnr family transcriptional regulator [Bacteroidota bacterium]